MSRDKKQSQYSHTDVPAEIEPKPIEVSVGAVVEVDCEPAMPVTYTISPSGRRRYAKR